MRRFLTYILSVFAFLAASAAKPTVQPDSIAGIVETINGSDGNITIVQSPEIDARLQPTTKAVDGEKAEPTTHRSSRKSGFRVQVFSDNNVRTAKANAEYRKRSVEQRMPGTRAYLSFESPYWRVRVGDYRTQAEAEAALQALRSAFPAFASDLRIVRERINAQ